MGSLQSQREYVARFIKKCATNRKTFGPYSKRQCTVNYYLPLNGESKQVCQKFFVATLGISQRFIRTVTSKLGKSGILEKEKRGGRRGKFLESDPRIATVVNDHINRFQKVESHYCRKDSTRQYLHADLTVKKMYAMLLEDLVEEPKPSYSTYYKIFKGKNLSFHRPKKDQCSLCVSFYKGTEDDKQRLNHRFSLHDKEKNQFRCIRTKCKEQAKNDSTILCATFDMQQVINIPISMDNSVYYKRRLSVYNFTVYNISSGNCCCYTWHEGASKRGASEISTALYLYLKTSDERGTKKAYLFADGCSGQNKNSIVASTLLYIVTNSKNIDEIKLRISVPCHGQNEGDSAHSAISYALKKSGDVHVPSQLTPIIKLARRKNQYEVAVLEYTDFLNFKKFSIDLNVLAIRKDDNGELINWTKMAEYRVMKNEPLKIYFKTNHTNIRYRSLTLKRHAKNLLTDNISKLNASPPKISLDKFNDLISLTVGDTPVIKSPEHVAFYNSLNH